MSCPSRDESSDARRHPNWRSVVGRRCGRVHEYRRAMELVESGHYVIDGFRKLLLAVECGSADELIDRIDDEADGRAWIDWHESDEASLVVCVGRYGTGLRYPFAIAEFWSTVAELVALDDE